MRAVLAIASISTCRCQDVFQRRELPRRDDLLRGALFKPLDDRSNIVAHHVRIGGCFSVA